MEKVIRIKLGLKEVYHVSWNPNNGLVTTIEDINQAAVFKDTEFDVEFAKSIIECIRQSYGTFEIKLVNKKIATNGSRLGEVGDFENETLKLLLNLN